MFQIIAVLNCLLFKIKYFKHFIMQLVQNIITLLSLCVNYFIHFCIPKLSRTIFLLILMSSENHMEER